MPDEKKLPPGTILQRDGQTYAARITPPSGRISAIDLEKMGIQTIKEKLGLEP